jgi:hypothetical protein
MCWIKNDLAKTTNSWRHIFVYTPPGYDAGAKTRHPVFYLQHGGGEDERVWIEMGRTTVILDNMFAAGKAKPEARQAHARQMLQRARASARAASGGLRRIGNHRGEEAGVRGRLQGVSLGHSREGDRRRARAGVRVNPGDIVTADENGVVVVPKAHAADVLKKAQDLDNQEHSTIPFIEKF